MNRYLNDKRGNSKIRLKNGRIARRVVETVFYTDGTERHRVWHHGRRFDVLAVNPPEPHGRDGIPISWEEA